jgi:hypothetical protein
MFNEEAEQYTEDDLNGNGESELDYDDQEFQKIRREHVFSEIDFTKRKSKIICTLGYIFYIFHFNSIRPATSEAEDIIKLFDAGMSCARFNMSHGNAKVIKYRYFKRNLIRQMQDY